MSGIPSAIGQQPAFTPLNTDFGHSPVGNLAGRSVRQVDAAPPRSIGTAFVEFGAKVKDLATRALNALTPHSVRADDKFRRGLEATSKETGNLLGALSKTKSHPVDDNAVKRCIGNLYSASEPLRSRGADMNQIVAGRLGVNLKQMDASQLAALREGITQAETGPLKDDPQTKAYLTVIKAAVNNEISGRMIAEASVELTACLETAIDQIPREATDKGAVSDAFGVTYGAASGILAKYGLAGKDLQHALIKSAMSEMGEKEPLKLGSLLENLTTHDLRDLIKSEAQIGEVFVAERFLMGQVGVRMEKLERAFQESVDTILAHKEPASEDPTGPLHNPQGFNKELVRAAGLLAELRTHAKAHSLNIEPETDSQLSKTMAHLEEYLRPSNLMLGELGNSQLHQLDKALKTLDVDRPAASITAELGKRREAAKEGYQTALKNVLSAAKEGNQAKVLTSLTAFTKAADNTISEFQRLGDKIDDADKIHNFREAMTAEVLARMSVEDLNTLREVFDSTELQTLAGGLVDVGYAVCSFDKPEQGNEPLGKAMLGVQNNLTRIGPAITDALIAKGENPPAPSDKVFTQAELSPANHQAIQDAFGVEAGTPKGVRVLSGIASPAIQDRVQEKLATPLTDDEKAIMKRSDGSSTGVTSDFWNDLGRTRYNVTQPDGATKSILDMDKHAAASHEDRRGLKMDAVAQLNELTGDPEMTMFISQYAHQGLLAGIQTSMMNGESPIRLPDGSSGYLTGPANTSITFSRSASGDIVARVESQVTNPTHLADVRADGPPPEVDPSSSSTFTVEYTFTPDREVYVSEPVRYSYNVAPKSV